MRHEHCRHDGRNPQQRIVLGICFVTAGVLALLGNLHIINIGEISNYWPLIFSVFGLAHLVNKPRLSGVTFGLGFIALGIGLTLQNLGIVHHVMSLLLPSFLILAGVGVIIRGFSPRQSRQRSNTMPSPTLDHDDMINISAIMSGASLRCDSQDFKGGELTAIMGGMEIDLRQASIQSQAELRVKVIGGGVAIKVPQDWQVVLRVSPVLGGIENKTISPMQANKTLLLQGDVIMGGIEIKN
jgi:predicted membrane protein